VNNEREREKKHSELAICLPPPREATRFVLFYKLHPVASGTHRERSVVERLRRRGSTSLALARPHFSTSTPPDVPAPMPSPPPPPVTLVIFDMDGLLLNVETIVNEAASSVLAALDLDPPALLTPAALAAARGRRPLDAWQATADALGLPPAIAAADLLASSEALLTARWGTCAPMPGAVRLVTHLKRAGVDIALATSTPRATFSKKTGPGSAWAAAFAEAGFPAVAASSLWSCIVCGDDAVVKAGKPAPDAFLAAAAGCGGGGRLPGCCLVLEDAPAGAQAAVAAGMRCVVIPSLPASEAGAYPPVLGLDGAAGGGGVTESLPSLFAFDPAAYALPPFTDALPAGRMTAIPFWPGPSAFRLRGTVVRGFGRGSASLGIPTANLDAAALLPLADAVTGVYACWAFLTPGPACPTGAGTPWPAVASIGYNPQFQEENARARGVAQPQRSAEPWLLAPPGALPATFYGAGLRLLVVAYLRPEARFEGLDALIAQIHADADAARAVLAHPALTGASEDEFFNDD